jgi:heme A synthase
MTQLVISLHYWNEFLVLATGAVTGIWGLILFFTHRTETLSPPWRIALIVTGCVAALQGLLGITLVIMGERPGTGTGLYWLHYVYGAIVVFILPVAVTYSSSGKNVRRDVLIFSIAVLILVAAAIRAMMTGPA